MWPQVICSVVTALVLSLICPSAIPQTRNSNVQASPTIQFVFYRIANTPLGMDAPTHMDIYSGSSEYADERQLTIDGHSFNPILSPDGTQIAYLHITAETYENCLVSPQYEINVMNVDGTHQRTLKSLDNLAQLSWSSDGKSLVYWTPALAIRQPGLDRENSLGIPDIGIISEMARLDSSTSPLYLISLDHDAPVRLLANNATSLLNNLEWSPDGKWIAYGCRSSKDTKPASFYICVLGTELQTKPTVLTEGAVFFEHFSWSPDGTQIAYFAFDREADKLGNNPYQLWVVRMDGSAPRLVTTTKDGFDTPQWSRNGKTIVFCDGEKNRRFVAAIKVTGSNKVCLTDPKLNASHPMWSVDGKVIAFTASVHGKMQVHLMNADGSELHALTHDSKLTCSNFTWAGNTHILLARCGQVVNPQYPRLGHFVDGGYYLLSADDPGAGLRPLTQRGAMTISFALDAGKSVPVPR